MKRPRLSRKLRDPRQREMLLAFEGGAPGTTTSTGDSGLDAIFEAIARAVDAYGPAQIAVWARSDQRTVENWRARRHAPSLIAALRLARELPEFDAALTAARGAQPERRRA